MHVPSDICFALWDDQGPSASSSSFPASAVASGSKKNTSAAMLDPCAVDEEVARALQAALDQEVRM